MKTPAIAVPQSLIASEIPRRQFANIVPNISREHPLFPFMLVMRRQRRIDPQSMKHPRPPTLAGISDNLIMLAITLTGRHRRRQLLPNNKILQRPARLAQTAQRIFAVLLALHKINSPARRRTRINSRANLPHPIPILLPRQIIIMRSVSLRLIKRRIQKSQINPRIQKILGSQKFIDISLKHAPAVIHPPKSLYALSPSLTSRPPDVKCQSKFAPIPNLCYTATVIHLFDLIIQ